MGAVEQPQVPQVKRPGMAASVFWGLLLIGSGLILLALNLGMFPGPSGGAVGVTLVLVGLALLASFALLHTHWWTLIAGPTSLALGAVILLPYGNGTIFLTGIGLGFGLVALTDIRRWWAIIPAGSLLTLALIASLNGVISAAIGGTLLFAGLGATFGVLSVIRVSGRAMRWPIYPAFACLGLAVLTAAGELGAIVWPILLIGAGALLMLRAATKRG